MNIWSRFNWVTFTLLPFSVIFGGVAWLRRCFFKAGLFQTHRFEVPIIIVGNITVGGSGKTPLVIEIISHLCKLGFAPGIVSRGYKSTVKEFPYQVRDADDAHLVGDEPKLLHRKTCRPVVIDANRPRGVEQLIALGCDVIVADDGLQHYALGRDLEIAVVDNNRLFGNGLLLPAGPLRESRARLAAVDFAVYNGTASKESNNEYSMTLEAQSAVQLFDSAIKPIDDFRGMTVHAVCGIGDPERFFRLLIALGLDVIPHAYGDHHSYLKSDLIFDDERPIFITEKDAVKCQSFNDLPIWVLPVKAQLSKRFWSAFDSKLECVINFKRGLNG